MNSLDAGAVRIVATILVIMIPLMLWDVTRERQPIIRVIDGHEYVTLDRGITHSASCPCESK